MFKTMWLRTLVLTACCATVLLFGGLFLSYDTIPSRDTKQTRFDAIIVLGTPAKADGSPGDEAAQRTLEAVREYRAGVAPHLILSGGKAHNDYIEEGQAMANFAAAQGVPRTALIVEGNARDTIQNIWYSKVIMDQHGWKSAEIVSSPSHLPRASLILGHYQFPWTTHPSPWPPNYSWERLAKTYFGEAVYCWQLRWHGFPQSKFLPGT